MVRGLFKAVNGLRWPVRRFAMLCEAFASGVHRGCEVLEVCARVCEGVPPDLLVLALGWQARSRKDGVHILAGWGRVLARSTFLLQSPHHLPGPVPTNRRNPLLRTGNEW